MQTHRQILFPYYTNTCSCSWGSDSRTFSLIHSRSSRSSNYVTYEALPVPISSDADVTVTYWELNIGIFSTGRYSFSPPWNSLASGHTSHIIHLPQLWHRSSISLNIIRLDGFWCNLILLTSETNLAMSTQSVMDRMEAIYDIYNMRPSSLVFHIPLR